MNILLLASTLMLALRASAAPQPEAVAKGEDHLWKRFLASRPADGPALELWRRQCHATCDDQGRQCTCCPGDAGCGF
ncbi:unnamed protein product [Zymoseptoria tritici ST99CH_1A5]|uniref:Conotoxin n=1 Tax=Zymoseptoria tritici ST99CH_1A5 TaxID=1276529 RepID=A0A1Y6LWE0_ZYMTR|nr:unnamed protein product [Zymoseptoria tritici ST99CH_1A5]